MKKFTTILLMLLMTTMGAWAQPDVAGKTFTMQCARGYVYYNGTRLAGTSTASDASKFALVTYNSNTYLFDVTQSMFVCHTTAATAGPNGNAALESSNDFSKIVKNISFGATNITDYPWYVQEDEFTNWLNMDGTPLVYFNRWTNFENGTGGNTYKIEVVDATFDATAAVAMLDAYFNPSATVSYVISDASGVIYTTEAVAATVGATITELPADYQRPYCTYNVTSTTIATGANTVPVTVTYTPPFTVSSDFATATWYYATLRGKQLRADESYKDGSGRYQTNNTNEKTDVYKWAFVGNPYNLSIINKGHEGKCLYAGDVPVMQTATPATDVKARWIASSNSNGGFNMRSESGANLYINDASNGGNLGYWNSSWAASDGGSNWVIEAVPAITVNVTYELYVGGTLVNTVVENDIAANSAVAVPASLTADYNSLAYNFTTAGTIGETDCTITVTATLKAGIVLPTALSNSKKYTLITKRGGLATYADGETTYLASACKGALNITAASEFAIIDYEGNKYLYSVADQKFVTYQEEQKAPLKALVNGTSDAIAFSQTTNSVYEIRFDNSADKIINSSANYTYGVVINSWGATSNQWDDGCQYIIYEVGDFDATDALTALANSFSGQTQFANAIAELKAINWGTGLNHYKLTSGSQFYGYAGNEPTIIDLLEQQGYSAENLAYAQDLLANYALNMPGAGFYLIKGNTSGKYLASGNASNGKYNMSDATDATTIFYFDGTKLTNYGSGMSNGMTSSSWDWVLGANASEVVFQDGLTNGGYGIKSATCNFYDNGDGQVNSADRGNNVTISATTNARYTSWYLEAVTELPITLNNVTPDNTGTQYIATLCLPVNVTITGTNAYVVKVNTAGDEATATGVTGVIKAGTPLVLDGDAASATATITTDDASDVECDLVGTYEAKNVDGLTDYFLSRYQSHTGWTAAFLHWQGTALKGFRAYLPASKVSSSAKGLTIVFGDETNSISNIELNDTNNEIYNLQGQKVNRAQRGVYIVNGKKVVIK